MRPVYIVTWNTARLLSSEHRAFGCILCETDVEVENLLTFSSPNKEYHLVTSQVGYDYRAWTSICSSKLFNVICP